jgi:hypothetical protein
MPFGKPKVVNIRGSSRQHGITPQTTIPAVPLAGPRFHRCYTITQKSVLLILVFPRFNSQAFRLVKTSFLLQNCPLFLRANAKQKERHVLKIFATVAPRRL